VDHGIKSIATANFNWLRHYSRQQPLGKVGQEPQPGEYLAKYCVDLTKQAREHKLDPVIGREDEIRRTIEVLSRRRKNNPVLIGEPGVGKTAIMEGLAQRIVADEVPETLKNKRVLMLDLAGLLAGSGVRGEFEQRLKNVIEDVEKCGDVILFVDEVHMLVGAGRAEGSFDAANMLKPALARGGLQFCGATTLEEYRKYIEKDGALARRLQTVFIPEPSVEDTISILRGLKDKYELHHRVTISDGAVVAAAKFAKRYFTDRKLPDKAIDLLDETASRLCMQLESKPDAIAKLERSILTRKIEVEALKKETDPASVARCQRIQRKLDEEQRELDQLNLVWERERKRRQHANKLKKDLEEARIALDQALVKGDYVKAGQLKHVDIPRLEAELEECRNPDSQSSEKDHSDSEETLLIGDGKSSDKATRRRKVFGADFEAKLQSVSLTERVTEDDVAEVVSRHTGIPLKKLVLRDKDRLLHLEEHLSKRVVGQERAVDSVANCVRMSRAGLAGHSKPQGVFLFIGPSGVGKTELAKALAEFLFDDEHAMVRIDMSEYLDKFSVTRLIGAPPGYVGYDEGGQLTEAVRRRPYQVVLFDEVEKAHVEVTNTMLQIFDEGHLTDGQGHKVDFRNTIIIMTSNLGAHQASQYLQSLRGKQQAKEESDAELSEDAKISERIMLEALQKHFAPEFLNRIDDIVCFNPLRRKDMVPIAQIQLRRLQSFLDEKRIELVYSDEVVEWLARLGYDPALGARPLKRCIQNRIAHPLSKAILSGEVLESSRYRVELVRPKAGTQFTEGTDIDTESHVEFKYLGPNVPKIDEEDNSDLENMDEDSNKDGEPALLK